MQVMALRGAKNSGLHVPDKTMKKALEYINTCYDAVLGRLHLPADNRAPGFARTAAGICVVEAGRRVRQEHRQVDRRT